MIPLVLVCAALAGGAYILFGYPLLLALWKGRPAKPVRKDLNFHPSVTVIVAVRNGEAFLHRKLESLLAQDYPRQQVEILVVSDGSTDRTEAIAESFADRSVRLLRQPWGGKATAINTALAEARGEVLFFTDVRQPLNHSALSHLVANLADPTIGVVSGELRLLKPGRGEQADLDLYWRYEIWVRNRHTRLGSILGATGCIYVVRRSLVSPIPADTLSDDVLIPVRAFLLGYRVVFEPEAQATDAPAVAGVEFLRRWRTLSGLWQVFVREPRLLVGSGPMTIHFLSHKLGRLLLPWILLVLLAATPGLPSGWFRTSLLALDATFILLALLDTVMPRWTRLKRLTSPARTFVVMNAASLAAAAVFFVSPQRLWRPTQVDDPPPPADTANAG